MSAGANLGRLAAVAIGVRPECVVGVEIRGVRQYTDEEPGIVIILRGADAVVLLP